LNYAKKHPIQKRSRKDSIIPATSKKNRYDGKTEEQVTTFRNRRKTPESRQKQNSSRKMKKDALCPESIAMENPAWVPEMESPIKAQHSATLEAAWNDPDFLNPTWRPFSISPKSEQSPDPVNVDANEMTNVSRHRNVTHGERQALCAQQNQRFQNICVSRPSSPLNEDEDIAAPKLPKEHRLDDSRKFLTSLIF
jgi:hypothetical protein